LANGHGRLRNVQSRGQKLDQRGVCPVVRRRRGDADLEGVAVESRESAFPSAGLDVKGQSKTARGGIVATADSSQTIGTISRS
jgi:hypothetical protein